GAPTAADLAALAGAQVLAADFSAGSPARACATARAIAVANQATVVSCSTTGAVVDVVVAAPASGLSRLAAPASSVSAHARAGPAP
ncbi:MAG TPA: hypothetical protein VF218_15145, partial [Acidothermaceae bacterium]